MTLQIESTARGDLSNLRQHVDEGRQVVVDHNGIGVFGKLDLLLGVWHFKSITGIIPLSHITQPWYFYADPQV